MITIITACTLMVAQFHGDVDRMQACISVGIEAEIQQAPTLVAIVMSWRESRFRMNAQSSVAIGPLQIIPKYWCPGGTAVGCDSVAGGIKALRRFIERSKGLGLEHAICRYNAGYTVHCALGRNNYSLEVMQKLRWLKRKLRWLKHRSA